MKTSGKLIILDGLDGCGKSSLASFIKNDIFNGNAIIVRAIGQGLVGQAARQRFVGGISRPEPLYETFLLAVGNVEAYLDFVLPALMDGKNVIMDRWISVYYAYQFFANNNIQARSIFEIMLKEFTDRHVPDLLINLDVDPEIAMKRLELRAGFEKLSSVDTERMGWKQSARAGFIDFNNLLKSRGYNFTHTVNACSEFEVVKEEVKRLVEGIL